MQEAAERELVSSSLLGRFGPIIVAVCTNAGNKYNVCGMETENNKEERTKRAKESKEKKRN